MDVDDGLEKSGAGFTTVELIRTGDRARMLRKEEGHREMVYKRLSFRDSGIIANRRCINDTVGVNEPNNYRYCTDTRVTNSCRVSLVETKRLRR